MAPSAPQCPSCAAPLVEIRLGEELTLRSCSRCDSRWWLRGDSPADLEQVLTTVSDTDGNRRPVRVAG
jgi:hypothetical protein